MCHGSSSAKNRVPRALNLIVFNKSENSCSAEAGTNRPGSMSGRWKYAGGLRSQLELRAVAGPDEGKMMGSVVNGSLICNRSATATSDASTKPRPRRHTRIGFTIYASSGETSRAGLQPDRRCPFSRFTQSPHRKARYLIPGAVREILRAPAGSPMRDCSALRGQCRGGPGEAVPPQRSSFFS